jgi:hypothetical protein
MLSSNSVEVNYLRGYVVSRMTIPLLNIALRSSKTMRKVFAKYLTGYCGEDGAEVLEYPDGTRDADIDEDVWQGAVDNAMMYGHEGADDPDSEDSQIIEGWWEVYEADKHEGRC